MKLKYTIIILTFLTSNSYATTDWKKLISEIPFTENEVVNIVENGSIQMNVIKRPNGKLRFNGFNNYVSSKEMELLIDSPTSDIEKLCNDYSLNKKTFKATLVFGVSPTNENFDFTLSDEKTYSTLAFENPFKLKEAQIEIPTFQNTAWILASHENNKHPLTSIETWVTNLFNNAIKSRIGNEVRVNLNDHNGLACDLAFKNITPKITKRIVFERSLPEQEKAWLSEVLYSEIFKSFWKNQDFFKTKGKNILEKEINEAFMLGYTVSNYAELKNLLLNSPQKTNLLLNSFKTFEFKKANTNLYLIDTTEYYKKALEYKVPFEEFSEQKVVIQTGELKIKNQN